MFTLKEIEKITKGTIVNGDPNAYFEYYSVRKDHFAKGIFYVPIVFRGSREEFILMAVNAGASGFMIDKNSEMKKEIVAKAKQINPEIAIVEVKNVNLAMYQLGLESRMRNQEKPVIAVTGSFGKTTLTSLIANVLKTEKKVLHDFENENNNTKLHLPMTLFQFETYEMAVLELGINDFGQMTDLSKLTEPSIAVINSIGSTHLENLKSKENVLNEKLHIVDYIKDKKIVFVNSDCEYLQNLKDTEHYQVIQYGISDAMDIKEEENLSFKVRIYGKETEFHLNLIGIHHVSNVVLAIKIAEIYQISYENIVKAIEEFQAVDGRLKVCKNNEKNTILIDDCYNCSLEAVKLGLQTASKIKSKRKIAVLGQMGALGEKAPSMHEELGQFFKNVDFDELYTTGEQAQNLAKGAFGVLGKENIKCFAEIQDLMEELDKNIQSGDLIYVKAAHSDHFVEIVKHLKEKFEIK